MMTDAAQADIRRAYVGGGPGAITSAVVWLVAAWVFARFGTIAAFAALFLGGMLIFPLSSLICRYGFARSPMAKNNPLAWVALESTIAMIGCLFAAWLLLPSRLDMVFPVAAIAVGTHYLPFKTAYGDRTFWALGAGITLVGIAGATWLQGHTLTIILAVAGIELAWGFRLTQRARSGGLTAR